MFTCLVGMPSNKWCDFLQILVLKTREQETFMSPGHKAHSKLTPVIGVIVSGSLFYDSWISSHGLQ